MNQQYFQVGEEVILESKSFSYQNGEYIVSKAADLDSVRRELGARGIGCSKWDESFYYELEGLKTMVDANSISGDSITQVEVNWWKQSSLRKKNEGSGDFQSLISSLDKDKVKS